MLYLIAKIIHLAFESLIMEWLGIMIIGDSWAFLPVSEYYHHMVSVI